MDYRDEITLLQIYRIDGEVRQVRDVGDTSVARAAVANQLAGNPSIYYCLVVRLIKGASVIVHDTRGLADHTRQRRIVEVFWMRLEPKGIHTRSHRLGQALSVAANLEEGCYADHPEQGMIRWHAANAVEEFIHEADEVTATAIAAVAARLRG